MICHVCPKLVCGCCEHIAQVPAPSRPIARGLAGPGLLAHVPVSKFVNHLPLYRQSEIYAREGVDLERSNLADWVGQSSQLLRPLINTLERHVMSSHKAHADGTPIGVLAPGNGKTKTARLWTYVRNDRPAGYSTDRKGQHPCAHFKNFSGILQADGYAGFAQLCAWCSIQETACQAHARSKFYDAYKDQASRLAANACPPEDIGGAPGYAEFLDAMTDPSHPEHDDMLEWHGDSFDPTVFEWERVNQWLKDIKV